ncbi:hypothetical protein [Citrobacter werkmanii]|uniref:hypothetical protein n=1 Tax=Citrobacter werkmanii TaxID=67827 RepID=UPI0037C98AF1
MYTLNEKQLTELREWLAANRQGIDLLQLDLLDNVIAELLELRKMFMEAKAVGVQEFAEHCRQTGKPELAVIADQFAPAEPLTAAMITEFQVASLVMLVKRLAYSLRSANPESRLPFSAVEYLKTNGLSNVMDVLR